MPDVSIFIMIGVAALVIATLAATLKIIRQQQVALVERLGKFRKALKPGPHLVVPFIDQIRYTLDMREQVVPFPPQGVITEDNLMVSIDSVIYFQIVDPARAACIVETAKAGHPVKVAHGEPTVMAMLECYEPSPIAWRVLSRVADAFMTVEDADAVAVMNYDKSDEIGQIDREMELSMRAGKRLIHIYELQRPGLHDLTERNTYYSDGLTAVWASRDTLSAHFDYEWLSFALHDYTALRELMKGE